MAKDLGQHAKRLDSRIKELNSELKKTKGKLEEATRNKQDKLLKSALSVQGNALPSIERHNQEILFLKQKIEDTSFVKIRLAEELQATIGRVRDQRVKEAKEKVMALESEKQEVVEEMKKLKVRALKLEGKLRKAFLDGALLPIPKGGYLVDQIMEAQGMVEEAKQSSGEVILMELGITLEEEPREPQPLIYSWKCGSCGFEKAFATEKEAGEFIHECEAEQKHQQRMKKEEVLS